jgi:hypothetical protein
MNTQVAMLTLLAVSIVGCSPAPAPRPVAEFNPASAPTVQFSVPDMMCPDGCGVAVKQILSKPIEEGKFDADAAIAALVDKQFDNSSLKAGSEAVAAPAVDPPAAQAN